MVIYAWYLAAMFNQGGPISTAQYGPFYNEESCKVAMVKINQEFSMIRSKFVCIESRVNNEH